MRLCYSMSKVQVLSLWISSSKNLVSVNSLLIICFQNFLVLVRIAKDVGLPNVLITCPLNEENNRALLNHHGTSMVVVCGDVSLPTKPGDHVKRILEVDTNNESCNQIVDNVVVRKWVWMATGEGIGNWRVESFRSRGFAKQKKVANVREGENALLLFTCLLFRTHDIVEIE